MTSNGEEVRGGGGRRAGGRGDSTRKTDPARYDEGAGGRVASSNRRGGGGGSTRPSADANGNGNLTHSRKMDEDSNNFMGEVDDTDGEMASIASSFSAPSPLSSVGSGGGGGGGDGRRRTGSAGTSAAVGTTNKLGNQNNGNGSYRPSSSSNGVSTQAANGGIDGGGAQAIPGVATRPAGVPFGASALSKNMPNSGRGRPRGLRPRVTGTTPRTGGPQRVPSFSGSAASSTQQQFGSTGGGSSSSSSRHGAPSSAKAEEVEARAAGVLAPGVPVKVAVKAAIKIESVMRVLIARGYVRRKLVSEVTAFSLIMERGIEVVKHPFSGKGKPKNVTVNFISRKGAMQLSWGGKSGVPLETIFGVTKGINTDALKGVVSPDRAENCFSLHTQDRTIDFEVDNPWLVLLVVRALRLFLGAHYDTLPAPTFFSHLCLRPRGSTGGGGGGGGGNRAADSPKQSLVWTSADKEPPVSPLPKEQTTRSTPTERASRDSASDESDDRGGDSGQRPPLPWEGGGGELDSAAGSTMYEAVSMESMVYPPAPDSHAPGAGSAAGEMGRAPRPPSVAADGEDGEERMSGTDFADEEDDGGSADRSPGGIMSLFSSGGRRSAEESSVGSAAGSIPRSRSGVEGGGADSSTGGTTPRGREAEAGGGPSGAGAGGEGSGQLTASQVLATRGMTKRLNLSKKLAANNTGPLKGRRFDLMALPMDPGQQDRRDRGMSEHAETTTKRSQGMSISIGAGYVLPEEKHRSKGLSGEGGEEETQSMLGLDSGRTAVVDDLNDKLQSLRRLCVPQARAGGFRPGRAPKTMAVKHMAFFQGGGTGGGKRGSGGSGAGGGNAGGGLGSVTDMWGDGVRRQYQTDMVRQKNQSVEDVHKRDSARTAMLVTRSGVHRVTRKAGMPESR